MLVSTFLTDAGLLCLRHALISSGGDSRNLVYAERPVAIPDIITEHSRVYFVTTNDELTGQSQEQHHQDDGHALVSPPYEAESPPEAV